MSITDPIADLLVSLRNGSLAGKLEVVTPFSNLKLKILKILKKQGFIEDYKKRGDKKADIVISLKYYNHQPVIKNVGKISKPGRRIYVGKNEIPQDVESNRLWILSTSQGVLGSDECIKRGIGGELICYVE